MSNFAERKKFLFTTNEQFNIMRLTGRRESDNVEDRRGMSKGSKLGIVAVWAQSLQW